MKIFRTANKIFEFKKLSILENKIIGFVPTMGALHQGHLALVRQAKKESDYCIVSIFVNPKQFNNIDDYNNYPKSIEKDISLLKECNCDILYLPENNDIYGNYQGYKMDFEGLDNVLEGKYRTGHFQGVVDVVYRLFDIIKPDKSYFGIKDYQQLLIIKKMIKQAGFNIEIVECPIVREKSGLAMSSRNMRLSEKQKNNAAKIYEIIRNKKFSIDDNPKQIENQISQEINNIPDLKTEYVIFCEQDSLNQAYQFEKNNGVMLCVAVYCDKVRLIDNFFYVFK